MKCHIICCAADGRKISYFAPKGWINRTVVELEHEHGIKPEYRITTAGRIRTLTFDEWKICIFTKE